MGSRTNGEYTRFPGSPRIGVEEKRARWAGARRLWALGWACGEPEAGAGLDSSPGPRRSRDRRVREGKRTRRIVTLVAGSQSEMSRHKNAQIAFAAEALCLPRTLVDVECVFPPSLGCRGTEIPSRHTSGRQARARDATGGSAAGLHWRLLEHPGLLDSSGLS